jgi:hypothetical protein
MLADLLEEATPRLCRRVPGERTARMRAEAHPH